MDVLVVNRLRAGACLRRCCGFSTPARSGRRRRKAIRPANRHALSGLVVATRPLRRILTDVANEPREEAVLYKEECFIDATFVMAKGGGAKIGPDEAREKA